MVSNGLERGLGALNCDPGVSEFRNNHYDDNSFMKALKIIKFLYIAFGTIKKKVGEWL